MTDQPLTPAQKAAATRARKKAEAIAKAAASARQQRRRERYQEWADQFPETAHQRLMQEERAEQRNAVPAHHLIAAPRLKPVERRIWE